jgi:DNA primase
MNIFNFIKTRVAILDVIQEYSSLKKAGGYWKGRCPFHHEKTASFTVSPHKEIFYCFGCHLSGDVITFIAKIEHCSPLEAARHLADKYGIDIPDTLSTELSATSDERNSYFELCKQVSAWCHENLRKNPSLLHYLQERGFLESNINYFTLGYFPGGAQGIKRFVEAMKKQAILAKDLLDAHIIAQGKSVLYSPFEDRLIFPIKDQLGRFCGFGGRIFKANDQRPKYYNSRETDHFLKGSLLFGLDLAKKSIQDSDTVFLVEGYTDCMAMVQHGFANTVATLGTSCTLNHLKTLSRYAQYMYVLYDGDSAGKNAIMRLAELCWQVSMELKVICLPAQEDPASFLAKKNDLNPFIQHAQDIFHFYIATLGTEFISESLSKKIQLLRSVLEILKSITDTLKRDLLLQKASNVFNVPLKALDDELKRLSRDASATPESNGIQTDTSAENKDTISILEKRLFCGIMNNIKLCNNTNVQYVIEHMTGKPRAIFNKLSHAYREQPTLDFGAFFNLLQDDEKSYASRILLEQNDTFDEVSFEQLLTQVQNQQWKIIVKEMKIKLLHAKNSGNDTLVKQLMQDFIVLQQQLMPHHSKNNP